MLAVDARDLVKRFASGWPRRRVTTALAGASLAVPRGFLTVATAWREGTA